MLSYCVCRIQQWSDLTRTCFCLVFIRKAWLFNTHLFVCQWKHPAHLALLPRNQSDNSNTLLHFSVSHLPFCSQHLLVCLRPSSPHLPHMLCFAKGMRAEIISLDTFIIQNSSERVRCQHSSAVLTFDFEQSIKLSAHNNYGSVPWGRLDRAGRERSQLAGEFVWLYAIVGNSAGSSRSAPQGS